MEYSGITQNKYFISVDPATGMDHSIIWIKSPSDDTMEILKPAMDVEQIWKTIMMAYGVPRKYWGK